MKWAVRGGLLAGLALFTGLLVWQGAGEVLAALRFAGWQLLLVAAVHLGVMLGHVLGWGALLEAGSWRAHRLGRIWWIGDAVNNLLPVAQVGGELVRARLLAAGGTRGPRAGASVVVALTLNVAAMLLLAGAGAAWLGALRGPAGEAPRLLGGIGLFAALLLGFFLVQRGRPFSRLGRWLRAAAGPWADGGWLGGAEALDREVSALYRERSRVARCLFWQAAARLVGVAEVWVALQALGHPVGWPAAFVLESLGQAVRGAGFAVPGALGVQEGGFLVLGTILGVPGEAALALSLVKRVRDLLLGVPALAAWQWTEGRMAIRAAFRPPERDE